MLFNLLHGDCLDLMESIPSKSIDMILCDLPYGTTSCKWDIIIPLNILWGQYERIIKYDGAIVLFGSQPFTSKLVLSNIKLFKYCMVWEKSKGSNFMHAKYQPLKCHEDLIIFSKSSAAYNSSRTNMRYYPQKTDGDPYDKGIHTKGMSHLSGGFHGAKLVNKSGERYPRSVQYFKTSEGEGKLHPTQKPILLLEYLIKTYTLEGDVVLDNCMGSGSTGVACKNTNRNFIGIEKDEEYFKIAKSRIENHVL